jgi:hypothetical protein
MDKAPGVSGSDFDYGAVIGGVRQTRLIWPDLGPSQFTALFGQSWSGRHKQAYWGELRFSQLVNQTDRKAMRFGATFRDERRNGDAFSDNRALGLSVEWLRSNGNGQQTTFGVSARDTRSNSATIDSRAYSLSASRSFGRMGTVEPRLTGSISTQDFRKWFSTAGGRRDDSLNLKVDVVFPEQSLYGFVPQLTVSGRRVWSNVDIYDRNAVSLSFTAVSRF